MHLSAYIGWSKSLSSNLRMFRLLVPLSIGRVEIQQLVTGCLGESLLLWLDMSHLVGAFMCSVGCAAEMSNAIDC